MDKKKYHRDYNRNRYHKKREFIFSFLGTSCAKCDEPASEIDHINPIEKSFEISQKVLSMSTEKLLKELVKCQSLCHECHVLKSITERGQTLARGTHGTLSSYRYCKCVLCKKAKSDWQKNYKKRALDEDVPV